MILVVDEVQNILRDSTAQILEFYRNNNIRAVVFFGTRYSGSGFVGELRAMMNGNLVRLSRPTPEQAISIVRSRIGSIPLLSNEVILMAYRKAQGNPRRLLQVCEDMCRAAVEEGKLSVSPSKILGVSPFAAAGVAEEDSEAETKHVVRRKPKARILKPLSVKRAGKSIVAPAAAKKSSGSSSGKKPGTKKARLPKPLAKPSEIVDASDSTSESGHYWGEFMGMQK